MKKIYLIALIALITCVSNAQTPIECGTWTQQQRTDTINANFDTVYGVSNARGGEDGIAFGRENEVLEIDSLGRTANQTAAIGLRNSVSGFQSSYIGSNGHIDGLIAHGSGNANIGSSNDSYVGGNQNFMGRRAYEVKATGIADPGLGIGNRVYIDVDAAEGDISIWFPNPTYDDSSSAYIEGLYGTGATSINGYIVDQSLSWPAERRFTMAPYGYVKGSFETEIQLIRLLKVEYSGGDTRVYIDETSLPFTSLTWLTSSYSPITPSDYAGGNGQMVFGRLNSSWGYGVSVSGTRNRAWNSYTTVFGENNDVRGFASSCFGSQNTISLSSLYASSFGFRVDIDGVGSIGFGRDNAVVDADYATVRGRDARATRDYQDTYAANKISESGDAQDSRIIKNISITGAGWHDFVILENLESNRSYYGQVRVLARQTGGTSGEVGESAAYEMDFGVETGDEWTFAPDSFNVSSDYIQFGDSVPNDTRIQFIRDNTLPSGISRDVLYYVVNVSGDSAQISTTLGGAAVDITSQGAGINRGIDFDFIAQDRELKFRNISDGGDGINTGVRARVYDAYFRDASIRIRIDGDANRNFYWIATTEFLELKY